MRSIAIKALGNLRDATLATLYPTFCRVCGAPVGSWRDGVACAACWEGIEGTNWNENFCAKCGLPLPPLPAPLPLIARRCGRCDDKAFACARACGPYEGALRESVLWLKMHPQLAPRLRRLLIATFSSAGELHSSESIIPMPLHPGRLAERTFNQAEIIASGLAAATGLRLDTASLVRIRKTEMHRAGMGARERSASLHGAFRVRAPRLIENRRVLLVDDVMTTSSTAHETAQTLIDGGASAVNVLTLARAVSLVTQ
ncbi:MAG: ComF family protein [Blastocatellia bacterium]|nr:ComF family protein [Blastocatellia bacterium]